MGRLPIIIVMASFGLPVLATTQINAQQFAMEKYISECGGKVYSKCNSDTLNQKTIYDDARAVALAQNKEVVMVIGADWCPACLQFDERLKVDPRKNEFFEKFVVIKINGDVSSTRTLARELGISYRGYPQAFVLNPNTNKMTKMFYPTMFFENSKGLVEGILNFLGLQIKNNQSRYHFDASAAPSVVGSVKTGFLEKEIALTDAYGETQFSKTGNELADKFINQGIAALHMFHYLDAYRSFHTALRHDNKSILARVGQVLAILQIGTDSSAYYFVNKALSEVLTIASEKPQPPQIQAWIDLAESMAQNFSQQVIVGEGAEKIKSPAEAFQQLLAKDPANGDGHALVSWLYASELGYDNVKETCLKVLEGNPNNVGAHHYLLHVAESANDFKAADQHAKALMNLAKGSAHAVHMYGHTLPQRGQWAEAFTMFMKAHEIHHEWSKQQGIDVDADWHYGHNMTLMAATLMGLGEIERANEIWKVAMYADGRAYSNYIYSSVLLESEQKFEGLVASLESSNQEVLVGLAKNLRNERVITAHSLKAAGKPVVTGDGTFGVLLQMIQGNVLLGQSSKDLSTQASNYFADRFSSGGFDGWSNSYIELLRLLRIAKRLDLPELVKELETIEFTIKTGAICSAGGRAQNQIKCLEPNK